MDDLQAFRFFTFQYFVEQFSSAEGLMETYRKEIQPSWDDSANVKVVVDRLVHMNTRERFRAIISLLDLVKPFDNAAQKLTQPEWIAEVNKIFSDEDSDSSDNINNGDPAASFYEFSPVNLPGGNGHESLGTVLKECSLINLDEFLISTGIQNQYRDKIRETALKDRNTWRVKLPYGGVHLYVTYQEAAVICALHSHRPTWPGIVEWLEKQALTPLDNPADRQRLRLLEAVDNTTYIITFLGKAPGTGHLVLLRASDGHVHVASFMRSCVGLPLRKRDVRDDHGCAPLKDLLNGQVTLDLDDMQKNALTIP